LERNPKAKPKADKKAGARDSALPEAYRGLYRFNFHIREGVAALWEPYAG